MSTDFCSCGGPLRFEWSLDGFVCHSCNHTQGPQGCGCAPAGDSEDNQLPVDKLRAALVDTAGLDDIPKPEWLVEGILHRRSLAWLIGPPGCGKSFISLDIAGCVGSGLIWKTHVTSQGPVLYLVAEGLSGIRPRVRAWEHDRGAKMENVSFLPVAVQAGEAASWQGLVDLVADMQPSLIVVDTQARVTVGLDENSARDIGEFIRRVDALKTAGDACVLIVHHQGRAGDHMRGSSALEGAADKVVKVAKDGDVITVESRKTKDGPDFDTFALQMEPVEYEETDGTTDNSAILRLVESGSLTKTDSPAMRRLMTDWWECHGRDWVSASVIVKSGVASESSFHRSKKRLVEAGILELKGEGITRRYRMTEAPQA